DLHIIGGDSRPEQARRALSRGSAVLWSPIATSVCQQRLNSRTVGPQVLAGRLSVKIDWGGRVGPPLSSPSQGRPTLRIVYDGDGNRVSETVSGTTTKYLVDTVNPTGLPQVLDETVSGSVT